MHRIEVRCYEIAEWIPSSSEKVSTVRVDVRWRGIDPGAHLDQPLDSTVAQICPLFSYRN